MDKIRAGIFYFSAGQRVAVEVGSTIIGHTTLDPKTGQHTFWFPSVADFEKKRKDLFEANNPLYKPIPCFEELPLPGPTAIEKPVVTPAVVNPLIAARNAMAPQLPPPPPLPEGPTQEEKDFVFGHLAGRKPRMQDFAAELNMEPAKLKTIIENDPRFAPIVGGWIRAAEQPTE